MNDISPQLLEEVKDSFRSKFLRNKPIARILRKVQKGNGTYQDCQLFSKHIGAILGDAFKDTLKVDKLPNGELYFNILESVCTPMFGNNHAMVNEISSLVATNIDTMEGLGLKPIEPNLKLERVKGIYEDVLSDGLELEERMLRLTRDTQNITESFFDEFIRENVAFKADSGLKPKVIRICVGSRPCNWCINLAGTYDYDEVSATGNDVWRRHVDCHCQVIYQNNVDRYLKGAHSKKKIVEESEINANTILHLDETK